MENLITLAIAATAGMLLANKLRWRVLAVQKTLLENLDALNVGRKLNEDATRLSNAWLTAHAEGRFAEAKVLRQQAFDAAGKAVEFQENFARKRANRTNK